MVPEPETSTTLIGPCVPDAPGNDCYEPPTTTPENVCLLDNGGVLREGDWVLVDEVDASTGTTRYGIQVCGPVPDPTPSTLIPSASIHDPTPSTPTDSVLPDTGPSGTRSLLIAAAVFAIAGAVVSMIARRQEDR